MAELKKKVVRGFAWNIAEKIASAIFQAWVVVNIINRIAPDQYALKAILAPLVAIFNVFVDGGFSQALIRNKNATQTDYSSAFWFNIAISGLLYALLVGLSYPAARLFDMPDLVRFAPVFFLIIPVGALGIIQQAALTREFDFRRISTIFFVSNIASGFIGVGLAFGGFGFWAIVGQRLAQTAIRSALYWIFGRWKPRARFSMVSIRSMFGFSSRLLGTDILNNLYNHIPNFIIGRVHNPDTLGFYEQARSLRDLPITSTMTSMQSVTFPALAEIRDNDDKFARAVGRVIGSIVFLMFPMMAGMIMVADEIFEVFIAPQWQPAVPFFRILCLAGFATPLTIISSNILRSRSDGRDVLRAEIMKKVIATLILAATIPLGVTAIAWGVVAIAFTDAAVSFTAARRQSSYGFRALARDVLPILALTLVMVGAVWCVGLLEPVIEAVKMNVPADYVPDSVFARGAPKTVAGSLLYFKIVVGVMTYIVGALFLQSEALGEFVEMAKNIGRKIKA